MTPSLTQIETWYDEFNETVFRNTLPVVRIVLSNTRCQLGQFYWGNGRGIGIKISLFWDRTEEQYRRCLLHEMCHLYCYDKGWFREGHGKNWKKIAAYATRVTGLTITRCEDISGCKPSPGNEERHKKVQEKKNAPAILLDLCYDGHHFIVKTTKKVLQSGDSTDWSCRVRTSAKSYRVVISDAPIFTNWQTSRSIHRGYRYDDWRYDKEIKPLLDNGVQVDDLQHLFQGQYDCLGIR